MQQQRIKPHVITYNASISACEKDQQWDCILVHMETKQKMIYGNEAEEHGNEAEDEAGPASTLDGQRIFRGSMG